MTSFYEKIAIDMEDNEDDEKNTVLLHTTNTYINWV